MKDRLITHLFAACLALAVSVMLASCNTIHGAGQDVAHVGNAVSNAAH